MPLLVVAEVRVYRCSRLVVNRSIVIDDDLRRWCMPFVTASDSRPPSLFSLKVLESR